MSAKIPNRRDRSLFLLLGAFLWASLLVSGCAVKGTENPPRFSAQLIAKIRMIELDQGQCSPALRAALEHSEAVVSPAE